jgi:hypothetical protein
MKLLSQSSTEDGNEIVNGVSIEWGKRRVNLMFYGVNCEQKIGSYARIEISSDE